ncbi:rho GTPase-activating protein gacJJ-like [Tribolium madens]|uniref:rho GTPase-activating protein gacJJ-like n=1 Tax=Tribolium madens TaxID=41895 RepID=UPI001CF74E6B|nr:rho GTPase-activating protein gacJJ-like [Tribolium madens]
MFLSDVLKKEECRNEALQELRKLGIKCRPKKPKQQNIKATRKVFKVPLRSLSTETVTLKTGQQIAVPKLVHELCSFILAKVSTEGLFRKEGSKVRQNEIKLLLNGGGAVDSNYHIIDVAALLKMFLRELPEPLIPYGYHELFLRCALLEKGKVRKEALLLACLLLPLEHLNTLSYLLQFFYDVTQHSFSNKMNTYNLAIVISPAIFPIEEKLTPYNMQMRTAKFCDIVQILIENAPEVGILPEGIIERLGSNSSVDLKKKKRRSGSLTRMFNGLKKIVGGKSEENHNVVTPDLLLTPINNNVVKRRRIHSNGISNKKKKELLNKLPDNVLLNTPFTPCRTPVSMDLSGTHENQLKETNDLIKEKKWFSRSRSVKNLKHETESKPSNTKALLERRWSAITQPNNLKKTKKRNSFAATSKKDEPDYIRVPKTEYEAIKNRVSAMERQISQELENVQSRNENNEQVDLNIQNVQTAYEQTLVQSKLSPTTDHLAKRLSRELKIRRSAEQKIIRSPSARKIGSMRRKSLEKNNVKLGRHQSWHVATPRVSLRRGKPNTVMTGLPTLDHKEIKRTRSSSVGEQITRNVSCNLSGSSNDTWVSAEGFFDTLKSNNDSSLNGRASLARLRSQNAGMVLAKAKLFDKLTDSDSSGSNRSLPRVKTGTKIGSCRVADSHLSYRVRSLKYEERKIGKKSMSPRKRYGNLTQRQKLQIAKTCLEKSSDKENIPDGFEIAKDCSNQKFASPNYSTPRVPPHIKKSLYVRSPKRLCRTPGGADRSTPLRVLIN